MNNKDDLVNNVSLPINAPYDDNTLGSLSPLVIGIVAGEASGDILGADFMAQMNNLRDDIIWVGVGGAKMQAQGLHSLFPLERLAVMGLVEVVAHLADLFKARNELLIAFEQANIEWFIGIDAPDFNLRVAKKLKPTGVFCVQYVSPSIWAWRESRIHGIKAATHLVLCLFPFELAVYERYHHPAVCVGHPLLHDSQHGLPKSLTHIPTHEQRRELIWESPELFQFFSTRTDDISQIICLMPGSRRSEIKAILPVMLDAAEQLLMLDNQLCFIIPTVNQAHQQQIQTLIGERGQVMQQACAVVYDNSQVKPHFSQSIMAMSDLVILASGTATLEAMLLGRPMIVVYQLNKLSYAIAKRLVKVPYVALPNILAGEQIVPELIQEEATGPKIAQTVRQVLQPETYSEQQQALANTARWLRQQSSTPASLAVIDTWYDVKQSQETL